MKKSIILSVGCIVIIGFSGCQKNNGMLVSGYSKGYSTMSTSCKEGNNLPSKYNLDNIVSQEKYYLRGQCRIRTKFHGGIYRDAFNKDGFNDDGIHKDTGTEYDKNGYNRGGYDKNGNKK